MSTRQITATFETPEKLLSNMLDDQAHGGIFHATLEDMSLGETVIVDLRLPEIPEGVILLGNVVWRRRPTNWRSSLVPGVGIAFHKESAPQRDFLAAYAQGKQEQRRKSGARFRMDIPVELGIAGISIRAWTRNVGRGGLYVPAETPPPIGQPVGITILPNELTQKQQLQGSVAWSHPPVGEDQVAGFGVSFRFANPIQRRRLHAMLGAKEAAAYRDAGLERRTMKW